MRRAALLLIGLAAPVPAHAQADLVAVARVLETTPLIDGHNDLPIAIWESAAAPGDVAAPAHDLRTRTPFHTDIERLRMGMVGGQFWSVFIPYEDTAVGAAKRQLEQIDIAHQIIARYPDTFGLALDASDVERVFGSGRIASLLGMEGGHAIEGSLGALRALYGLGVRYMTLTHNTSLAWADAAAGERLHGGLTEFGKEVVQEMNRMGMLVDLAHTSPETMNDALDVSEAPVIWSHAGARAMHDHVRVVVVAVRRLRLPPIIGFLAVGMAVGPYALGWVQPTETTDALAEFGVVFLLFTLGLEFSLPDNGGVVMVVFYPLFLSAREVATVSDVADHIEHVADVAGVDHVGLGSDFDGIPTVPLGLEDVSKFPALLTELSRRGWSEAELAKVAGENVLRVMREAEAVARRLQRARAPSTRTIAELDSVGAGR